MKSIRLTKDFSLNELLVSQTAVRFGKDVQATEDIQNQLKRLCVEVLQPIRDELGPVFVLSGYRPKWLNDAVGGSKTSDHMFGRAADFNLKGYTPYEACKAINTLIPHLPYKQMILEFNRWVHISVSSVDETPKREQLTAIKREGKTVYMQGILK